MSLERLQRLLLGRVATPMRFFELCREYVRKLAHEYGGPVVLAFVGPNSRMILPVMAHSAEADGDSHADEVAIFVDMLTVFASQSYVLGSAKNPMSVDDDQNNSRSTALGPKTQKSTSWMFDRLVESIIDGGVVQGSPGFFRAHRGKEVCRHKEEVLIEYECTLQSISSNNEAKHVECRILEPSLGGEVAATGGIDLADAWFIRVFRFAPRTAGPELYLLVIAQENPDNESLFLKLSDEAAIAGYRIIDELRSQVSSVNPRYISRYFQIEIGEKRLEEVLDRAEQGRGMVYGEFLRSLFDGRGHEVSMRRLLRFASEKGLLPRLTAYIPEKGKARRYAKYLLELKTSKPRLARQLAANGNSRVVVVASPRGGVGKTTVSYALARYLAQRGDKTCFVELDLASPTVYTLDKEFEDFLSVDNPVQAWTDPVTHLMDVWSTAKGTIPRKKRLDSVLQHHVFGYDKEDRLHVIGASPRAQRPGDMLAQARAQGGDVRFLRDLIDVLRSKEYKWIFIDTAAGLRDFSMAALLAEVADVALIFAHATKPSLLTALVHLAYWYADEKEETLPIRILALNEVRDIDDSLFKDMDAVDDFAVHWGNSKKNGLLPLESGSFLVDRPDLCAGICRIPWHEPWSRPEGDSDGQLGLRGVAGADGLLKAIGADVEDTDNGS